MTDPDEMAPHRVAQRESRSLFRSWKIIAILLVLIAGVGGGAGYWYFALRKPAAASIAQAPEPEAPLPFYLEIKPFVVSVSSSAGTPHFVQLGLNLTLSGSAAGNAVSAVLPELQDAMRQTVLAYKVDDIMTPAGVDKMRKAMIESANRVLLQRLGAERVKRLGGAEPDSGIVENIYFSTLIVE
jgi:flagellar basal body-associated protein FliL